MARGIGDALPVIARAGGDDAPTPLVLGDRKSVV